MVSMKDVTAYLEQSGIKGMRWGVRKAERQAKKAERQVLSKWELDSERKMEDALYSSESRMMRSMKSISMKPDYKGKDLRKKSPLRDRYHEEVRASFEKILNEETSKTFTPSPVQNLKATVRLDYFDDYPMLDVVPADAAHASPDGVIRVRLELDDLGEVVGFTLMDNMMQTSMDVVAHYGVKGMHWGVRRSSLPAVEKSHDAANAQEVFSKAKKAKTTDVLSNKELQDFISRVNLEMSYSRLTMTSHQKAKKFVKDFFAEMGKSSVKRVVNASITDEVDQLFGLKKKG